MAKRQLSKGQQRRVAENHQRKLTESVRLVAEDHLFGEPQEAVVVSRFGKQAAVENAQGLIYRCNIRRTLASLVTGDWVIFRPGIEDHHVGIIEAVHPRKTVLSRPDYYDGLKPVAANIDQIIIVSAVLPAFSTNIVDRYLVACENVGITPIIALNKIDLLEQDPAMQAELDEALAIYRKIGYTVVTFSSETKAGLAALSALLHDKTSIVVGQSGVGKSSLLNAILPETQAEIETGKVSDNSGLGQHTTTATRLYHLPDGGNIIDSPGVREFGLWHLEPSVVAQGFIEFRPFLGACKFRDCKHISDPGCALHEAIERGEIHPNRFHNFLKILESMAEVKTKKTFQ